MNAGEMPAAVAETLAAKYHLPMQAILNGTMEQDPHACYWKVTFEVPHGSLICVPVSDQMMLAVSGPSANKKYGVPAGMTTNLDLTAWKAIKQAEFAKHYGAGPTKLSNSLAAIQAHYQEEVKAQLNHEPLAFKALKTPQGGYEFKPTYAVKPPHHKNVTPTYDPPTKPAKVGQQISLDI